ncbi:MAG: RNA-directed DNA polymerase, partial [Myxococcota bacterium]
MASKRIAAFVAQRKLAELQRSRERLLDADPALEDEARGVPPAEALRALARGLAALRHANGPVHPEIVNLEVTLGDPAAPTARWLERLWDVVRQGRARADVISLYGGALGEWLAAGRRVHLPSDVERDALLADWTRPSGETRARDAVAARVSPDAIARGRALVADGTREALDPSQFVAPDPDPELLTAAGRADARSLPRSPSEPDPSRIELQAALRLAWADALDWDWPADGVALQPVWTGHRFRLRPKLDYLTAVTVEAIGEALAAVLRPWSGRANLVSRLRVARLIELSAPTIILDTERITAATRPDPLGAAPADLGDTRSARRARWIAITGDDDDAYGGARLGTALALVWADVQRARATGRPLYVYKTDVASFYPSVSHRLVDALLAGVGVDPGLRALVGRVLRLRRTDGTRHTTGLPLGLTASRVLGELVLDVVIGEVHAAAPGVDVLRMVDDLVLTSEDPEALRTAKDALDRALGDAGLAIHPDKTGLYAVGGPLPWSAPPVTWGLLALGDDGWTLADGPYRQFLDGTRAHVAGHDAVLDRIAAWRRQLGYLWAWLAPAHDLGSRHLDAVRAAFAGRESLERGAADG